MKVFRLAATLVVALAFPSSSSAQLTFSRVTTAPSLGRLDYVLAVADFNGDRRDDVLVGGRAEYFTGDTPAARLTKAPLYLFVSLGDGRFRPAPELVDSPIEARNPIAVAGDFNGDRRADLAVFDAGVYINGGYGNPPQLWMSGDDGRLHRSAALADAVRRQNEAHPEPRASGPADLHLKSASVGDSDGDGDLDIWVESSGGANVTSHFMVNNGDGTFGVDQNRVPYELLHNPQPEYWRHQTSAFVDIDDDGDLDLTLGQMRDLDPTHINQFSLALVNDGSGRYPRRIELPHPAFNDGYTAVHGLVGFDVNADGRRDLILVHQRNDDGPPGVIPWTGRYVQILTNLDGGSFIDETARIGDQRATTPERNADGNLANAAIPELHDVDRDGCQDLVMVRGLGRIRADAPLVYRNTGRGTFEAMPPESFAGSDRYFGVYAVPADVNGDGVIDFVVPDRHNGPDGRFGTADDFTSIITLLNTTPPQPVRCGT